MNIIRDVLAELWSMFVGDARLTMGIVAVVAAAAFASVYASPLATGVVLLVGSVVVLAANVLLGGRKR
jgi:hypothetical protein